MDTYIGTKIVKAKPMTGEEFHNETGRPMADHQLAENGYLVIYEDGYKSWSPKGTFERAYRRVSDAEKALLR